MTFSATRPNKFRNERTTLDGIRFASKREARRYADLKLLVRAGEITNLELQPVFNLAVNGRPVLIRSDGYPNGRQAKYVADFAYRKATTGERVIEDAKGFRTPEYRLKKAIVEAMHPGLRIVEV